jgi:hypothetical protein
MKSLENSRFQKQVFAEIILGSPRARCARFGICEARLLDLEAWHSFKPRTARTAKALLIPGDAGDLAFFFPPEGMLQLTFEYFFGTGFFRVDVPTQLPKQLLEPLNLEAFVVKKGIYPCSTQASRGVVLTVEHDFNCIREIPYDVAGEVLR